jgi:hypothetical protein
MDMWALRLGVNLPGREGGYYHTFSVEVKLACCYSIPSIHPHGVALTQSQLQLYVQRSQIKEVWF